MTRLTSNLTIIYRQQYPIYPFAHERLRLSTLQPQHARRRYTPSIDKFGEIERNRRPGGGERGGRVATVGGSLPTRIGRVARAAHWCRFRGGRSIVAMWVANAASDLLTTATTLKVQDGFKSGWWLLILVRWGVCLIFVRRSFLSLLMFVRNKLMWNAEIMWRICTPNIILYNVSYIICANIKCFIKFDQKNSDHNSDEV